MGDNGRDVFNTFELKDDEKDNYAVYIKKLDAYFLPKVNTSVERNKFNSRIQVQGEPIDSYVKNLRELANNCAFGNFKDELMKDRIVCGVSDRRVKERLLREAELTLDKAIEIGRAAEIADLHIKYLKEQGHNKGSDANISVVTQRRQHEK